MEKLTAKTVPYSSVTGQSVALFDEDGAGVAILSIRVPSPSRDYQKDAGLIATRLVEVWNMQDHYERTKNAYSELNDEVCQILGKALGYPWFKDDQKNFPGATKADGVCVGDHVAESIAEEAAKKIKA